MRPKPVAFHLLIVMVLFSVFLAACGGAATPTTTAPTTNAPAPKATQPGAAYPGPEVSSAQPTAESGYPAPSAGSSLQIVKPDGSTVTLSISDLQNVVTVETKSGDQTLQGYPLNAVLLAAGASDYTQVVVSGATTATFTKEQLTPDALIVFPQGASPQLVGNIPADQQVKDITKVEVK